MGFLEFKDGDWISIMLRSGEQITEQWCEDAVLIQDDGTPCFHFYIYEPDGCTDLLHWDQVASIKPSPPPEVKTTEFR